MSRTATGGARFPGDQHDLPEKDVKAWRERNSSLGLEGQVGKEIGERLSESLGSHWGEIS